VNGNTHRQLNIDEFRAFTLVDEFAPLIFINGRDSWAGRVFSLIHEIVHVGIGVCSFFNADFYASFGISPVETFCNAVSAETLAPNDVFMNKWFATQGSAESRTREIAGYFRCSQTVIARRALDNALISDAEYQALARRATLLSKQGSGGDFYKTKASRIDKRFLWALESRIAEGRTLYTEAYRLTDTNRTTFDKLVKETRGER